MVPRTLAAMGMSMLPSLPYYEDQDRQAFLFAAVDANKNMLDKRHYYSTSNLK
jgi:hypothetical protein